MNMSTENGGGGSMIAFDEAKNHLQTIGNQFSERCVQQCVKLLTDDQEKRLIRKDIQDSAKQKLDGMAKAMREMQNALSRQKMKLVFVGKTSAGKSMLINAILGKEILPSAPGHTTNCFIELSGDDHEEAELSCDGKQIPIQDIEDIVNAAESGNYELNKVFIMKYPKHECAILKHDLVILDTPGLDNNENLDSWLFEKCSDCDVIVLVVDSTVTIGKTEREFVEALRTCFSTFTNVFVVFNKWDRVIEDLGNNQLKIDKTRKQHEDKAKEFVANVLHGSTAVPESKSFFFLSSRNILFGINAQCPWNEFPEFETVLMKTASISALQGKIEHHLHQLQSRFNEFAKMVKSILEQVMADGQTIGKLASEWKSLSNDLDRIISDMHGEISDQIEGKLQQFEKHWSNKLKEHMGKFSWQDEVSSEGGKNACGKAIYSLFLTFWRDNKSLIVEHLNQRVQEAFQIILLQAQEKIKQAASGKRLCLCVAIDPNKLKDSPGFCTESGSCPSLLAVMKNSSLLNDGGISLEWEYVEEFDSEVQNVWEGHLKSMPSINKKAEVNKIMGGFFLALSLVGIFRGVPMIVDGVRKLMDKGDPKKLLKEFENDFGWHWNNYLKQTSDSVAKDMRKELSRCLNNFAEKDLVQVWEKHANELFRLNVKCRGIAEDCVGVDRELREFSSKYSA